MGEASCLFIIRQYMWQGEKGTKGCEFHSRLMNSKATYVNVQRHIHYMLFIMQYNRLYLLRGIVSGMIMLPYNSVYSKKQHEEYGLEVNLCSVLYDILCY